MKTQSRCTSYAVIRDARRKCMIASARRLDQMSIDDCCHYVVVRGQSMIV